MDYSHHELYPHYESLWQEALPAVRHGNVVCDERALRKEQDQRRGMTVIARLAPDVLQRIGSFLNAVRQVEPHQYYYPLADIHLTVLSLFTAIEHPQPYLTRAGDYIAAVAVALASAKAFLLDTVGITLASDAVLTQGFPHDACLAQIRDRLRTALTEQGLGSGLDQRYSLRTAHNTVIRFTAPLQSADRFEDALHTYRHCPFGTSTITTLELVVNDWYLSSDRLVVLKTYKLDL